jgi:hypothetical protein
MFPRRVVTVSRFIPAPAAAIFDVLAQPRRHHEIDGSGTVQQIVTGPERLSLGARFTMGMSMGVGYKTVNRVVVFEENKAIAWHHMSQFVWRYDLKEVDGGTEVTESFDYRKPWGVVIIWLGWPERNRRAMAATLERLEKVVTGR